jgi:hypothetical protein
MTKITDIIDSRTNNVCRKDTDYKNCGVAGSVEAAGHDFESVKEMRASQQRGGEGTGTQPGNYNDQEAPFAQQYAAPSDAPDDDTSFPSGDSSPLTWLGQ